VHSDYYGTRTYAHEWVLAALTGARTNFSRGNVDFTNTGAPDDESRKEAAKKGSAYMNVWMCAATSRIPDTSRTTQDARAFPAQLCRFVIGVFEAAIDECERGQSSESVHSWDQERTKDGARAPERARSAVVLLCVGRLLLLGQHDEARSAERQYSRGILWNSAVGARKQALRKYENVRP